MEPANQIVSACHQSLLVISSNNSILSLHLYIILEGLLDTKLLIMGHLNLFKAQVLPMPTQVTACLANSNTRFKDLEMKIHRLDIRKNCVRETLRMSCLRIIHSMAN